VEEAGRGEKRRKGGGISELSHFELLASQQRTCSIGRCAFAMLSMGEVFIIRMREEEEEEDEEAR
jgi:hypothetical protein